MTQWTYFAQDGSYGDAKDLVIINTTSWDDYQWETIATSDSNDNFLTLAEKIAFDNNSYVIYGDEVAVEKPACERCLHITDDEVERSYQYPVDTTSYQDGINAGLSTQDAAIYAARIKEVK